MATRTAKIKSKITYAGKGKKNPVLPEGVIGALTIAQGDVTNELTVYRLNGDVLFAKKELLAALGLRAAQVKNVPVIELGEGKKPAEYYTAGQANLVAATARVIVGASPVTGFLLAAAFEGHAERLVSAVAEFAAPTVAE